MGDGQAIREGLAILLPVIVLVLIAAALPLWLTRRFGQDLKARAATIAVSSLAMMLVSGGYFAVLYLIEAPRVAFALIDRPMAAAWHFLWLGLMAGLIWAPVVVLAATIRPRG